MTTPETESATEGRTVRSGSLILGIGSLTNVLLIASSGIAMAALAGPETVGYYGWGLSAATVLEILISGRTEQLLPVVAATRAEATLGYVRRTARRRTGLFVLASLPIALLRPHLWPFVLVVIFIGYMNALYNVSTYALLARRELAGLSKRRIVCGICLAVSQVSLAPFHSAAILGLGYIVSRLPMVRAMTGSLAHGSLDSSDRKAGRHILAGQLASNLCLQIPTLASGVLFSARELGPVVVTRRFIGQPAQITANSISEALFGTGHRPTMRDLKRTCRFRIAYMLIAGALLFVLAPTIESAARASVPPEWELVAKLLVPTLLAATGQILMGPVGSLLALLRLESIRSMWQYVRLLAIVLTVVAFRNSDVVHFQTALAIASFATYLWLPIWVQFLGPTHADD